MARIRSALGLHLADDQATLFLEHRPLTASSLRHHSSSDSLPLRATLSASPVFERLALYHQAWLVHRRLDPHHHRRLALAASSSIFDMSASEHSRTILTHHLSLLNSIFDVRIEHSPHSILRQQHGYDEVPYRMLPMSSHNYVSFLFPSLCLMLGTHDGS